ncbi:MAG: DUF4843 domain-containing protein [Bacteroidetes bacterium]|nr:DUF4843 domain-containing protein [Bacteroidota bacterium]
MQILLDKKLWIKLVALAALIVCLSYVYKYTAFKNDIKLYADAFELIEYAQEQKSEVIYLGESSNNNYREDDIDKRPISAFLADYFTGVKVTGLTKEASHAQVYYHLLKNIPSSSKVKTVIVTMNLRSFDAFWIYSPLENYIQKSLVFYQPNPPFYNRLMLGLHRYTSFSDSLLVWSYKNSWRNEKLKLPPSIPATNTYDWDSLMNYRGVLNADSTRNNALTDLACNYIKTFAFNIDTANNVRIKDFDAIVKLANERGWNLYFNLMAENVFMADSLVGDELVKIIRENRNLLMQRYNCNGVTVIDNLELVPSDEYIDVDWTTEHYAQQGRQIIAANVANHLRKQYPRQFATPQPKPIEKLTTFYNNCEGNINWSQMQTVTMEEKFAGLKSSYANSVENYTVTLEKPVSLLAPGMSSVVVSFNYLQKTNQVYSMVVIEYLDNESNKKTETKLISELKPITDKWQKLQFKFSLPSDFYSKNTFKVYVYNNSKSKIFIDEFKVLFE